MANNKVGVEFYVAGSSKFNRDIRGVGKSLMGVAKLGAGFMGGALSVRYIGRAMREFYSDAISNSKEAVSQIQAINSSWAETKKLLGTGLGDTMTPFYRDVNRILESVNTTIKSATELQNLFNKLTPSQQAEVSAAYEQQTGGKFGYYAATQADSTAINRAMGPMGGFSMGTRERIGSPSQFVKPEDQIVAYNLVKDRLSHDQIYGVTPEQEAARQRLAGLNESMGTQIEIQRELNKGNRDAARDINYLNTVNAAYGKGTKEATAAMIKYNSAMEIENELRHEFAMSQYTESMQQEKEYLELIQQGRKGEAEALKQVNELKRQGIELDDVEKAKIQELQEENRKLSDHYGDSYWGGSKSAIREMQDEMYTLGDISHDVTRELHDGVTTELNDALWESKDLGDAFENAAKSAAKMATQMLISNAVTGAMGGGGQFVGSLFKHARGTVLDHPISWMEGNDRHIAGEVDEAIMPLTRGPGGRLGVQATGGMNGRQADEMIGLLRQLVAGGGRGGSTPVLTPDVFASLANTRRGRAAIAEAVRMTQ